jgi:hypothetical protein
MEREHNVPALEVGLAIEVGGIRHDPPPTVDAMNVPYVVTHQPDELGCDLLKMDHAFAGLVLHIGAYLVRLG